MSQLLLNTTLFSVVATTPPAILLHLGLTTEGGQATDALPATVLPLETNDENASVSTVGEEGGGGGEGGTAAAGGSVWENVLVIVLKSLIMGGIIVVSIMGNVLVIVSIGLNRKLQVLTNYFLVSLAIADMLVASCAMTFNASVEISGRWLFGYVMCDVWNAFDVYFSTVSILNLCCISVDRYYAIVKPLEYPLYMTKGKVIFMLTIVWIAPTLISFIPIFLGWYATADHLKTRARSPETCTFEVNQIYAILSSAFSFWIPCMVMLVLYYRILMEARKQEAAILSRTNSTCTINNVQKSFPSSPAQQILAAFRLSRRPRLKKVKMKQKCQQEFQLGPLPLISRSDLSNEQGSVSVCEPTGLINPCTNSRKLNSNYQSDRGQLGLPTTHETSSSLEVSPRTISPDFSYDESDERMEDISPSPRPEFSRSSSISINGHTGSGLPVRVISPLPFGRKDSLAPPSNYSMSVGAGSGDGGKNHPVMRREHKAARTLGIIMGTFILCWLPFFTWYVAITICGNNCPCPQAVVTTLFWIGYFNSTLNPFIYAYFRTDFRDAFKKTLRQLKCCVRDDDLPGSFV